MNCYFAGILASFLVLLSQIPAAQSQNIKLVEEERTIENRDIRFVYAVAPDRYELKLRARTLYHTDDLSNSLNCDGIAMTGGFWKENDQGRMHDGLVEIEGTLLSPQSESSEGGVVVVGSNSVRLFRISENWHDEAGDKIQTHPILILGGKLDRNQSPRRANRVALGKLNDSRLLMAMAFNDDGSGNSAITFQQFAKLSMQIVPHKIEWLVAFDGGLSAFLYSSNREFTPTFGAAMTYLCAE